MSVVINPSHKAETYRRGCASPASAVEMWDVSGIQRTGAVMGNVRTLPVGGRTVGRTPAPPTDAAKPRGKTFESHRENRESVILGGLFTVALLLGSAFGGVFSGGGEAPMEESAHVSVASAR